MFDEEPAIHDSLLQLRPNALHINITYTQLPALPTPTLGPDTRPTRRQYAVRIQRILNRLVDPQQRLIAKGVRPRYLIGEEKVGAIPASRISKQPSSVEERGK